MVKIKKCVTILAHAANHTLRCVTKYSLGLASAGLSDHSQMLCHDVICDSSFIFCD